MEFGRVGCGSKVFAIENYLFKIVSMGTFILENPKFIYKEGKPLEVIIDIETYSKIKLKSGIDFIDCLIGHTAITLNIPLHRRF